jgi:hypothetical protein
MKIRKTFFVKLTGHSNLQTSYCLMMKIRARSPFYPNVMFCSETFYGIYLVNHLPSAGSNDVCSQQPVGFLREQTFLLLCLQQGSGFVRCSVA